MRWYYLRSISVWAQRAVRRELGDTGRVGGAGGGEGWSIKRRVPVHPRPQPSGRPRQQDNTGESCIIVNNTTITVVLVMSIIHYLQQWSYFSIVLFLIVDRIKGPLIKFNINLQQCICLSMNTMVYIFKIIKYNKWTHALFLVLNLSKIYKIWYILINKKFWLW